MKCPECKKDHKNNRSLDPMDMVFVTECPFCGHLYGKEVPIDPAVLLDLIEDVVLGTPDAIRLASIIGGIKLHLSGDQEPLKKLAAGVE